MTTDAGPLLELRGITRRYPGVLANDRVDLRIGRGAIHGLIGENGAGKSTLVKILYGVVRPDAGEIWFNGERVQIQRPSQARELGIAMVFQHFSLFEPMSVIENVRLALPKASAGADLETRLMDVAQQYGMSIDPDALVDDLSVGEHQRIEILRCLLQNPRLLVMDEPTSVLTPQESDQLFVTLRKIASEGCSILFISHKLDEVRALCERATILRGGRVVAECDPREESAGTLASMMVGEELSEVRRVARSVDEEARLTVTNLDVAPAWPGAPSLSDVSFSVARGEIFGIAGVAGNGQNELLAALSGETVAENPGAIVVDGRAVGHHGARERRRDGLGFVPEDRLGHGAVPDMDLVDNAFLTGHVGQNLLRYGLVNGAATEKFADEIVTTFDVRTGGTDTRAGALSGGNLQKFILGREILQSPGVLIVAHPTWGVDAGAAVLIRSRLIELAEAGTAIVVVSQDLDELMQICDRIAVLSEGRLSDARDARDVTLEQLGLLMMGESGDRVAAT